MTEKQINHALEELRQEIDKLHIDSHEAKDRLNALLANIEQSVGTDGDDGHHHLIAEMRQTIAQFEVEHPRITGIINDIMMTLSNMGI